MFSTKFKRRKKNAKAAVIEDWIHLKCIEYYSLRLPIKKHDIEEYGTNNKDTSKHYLFLKTSYIYDARSCNYHICIYSNSPIR